MSNILKRKHFFSLINLVLILGVVVFVAICCSDDSGNSKVVYIDNIELFNGFNMSKDMSNIHTKKIKNQTKKLDSLYRLFQLDIKSKDENKIKLSQHLVQKEDETLTAMKQYFSKEVSQQIWDRLNGYIDEYGKLYEYKLILGTQGGGNVMYADDSVDLTIKLLEYANSKYEGE